MHKLFALTDPARTVEPVKLHFVPAGAMRCQMCSLEAPRMRMFYTDDFKVWSAIELRDAVPMHAPKLVDDRGRIVRAVACKSLPF